MLSIFSSWELGVKTFICLLLLGMGWIQHQLSKEKRLKMKIFSLNVVFLPKTDHFQCFRQILNFDDFQPLSPFNRIYGKQPSPWEKKTQRWGAWWTGEKADFFHDLNLQTRMYSFFSESDVCRICMSYDLIWKSGNPPWARNKTYYIHDTVTKFLRSFGLGNHGRFSAYRRPRPLNTVHLALKFSSW